MSVVFKGWERTPYMWRVLNTFRKVGVDDIVKGRQKLKRIAARSVITAQLKEGTLLFN